MYLLHGLRYQQNAQLLGIYRTAAAAKAAAAVYGDAFTITYKTRG